MNQSKASLTKTGPGSSHPGKSLIAAAVQLRPQSSLEESLASAEALIQRAVNGGSQLVVLPENFAYLGRKDLADMGLAEQTASGPVRRFLANQAQRHAIWLVGGTIPVAATVKSGAGSAAQSDMPKSTNSQLNKPFACSLLVNPRGEEVARYDKIHLFDADVSAEFQQQKQYRESDDYRAGGDIVVADTDLCRLGMTVCYDLRFAELYRQLADNNAQVISAPAAFTAATGRDHWELLLRARAVENQVFMIGANMVDRDHPRRGLWGGSAIVDPWGTVLAQVDDQIGVAIAEIDLGKLADVRHKMPIRQHRKL